MPELKQGWRRVKFGDVVRQVKDRVDPTDSGLSRFVAGEHMDTDDLTIRRWGVIGESDLGPAFHMRFRPSQVLYGSRRTYLRKVALAHFEGICANTTFVLESANTELLLPDLLPFIMQSEAFHSHSKRESKGSVNPYVNFSDLVWYEFALPPLDEQRRLSRLFDSARGLIEAHQTLASSTLLTRRSLGKRFFIESPEGDLLRIGDIAEVRNGTTPRRNDETYWSGDIPWLTTSKVSERFIDRADEFITEKALQECSLGGIIRSGSTLIAMIGEGVTRGKAAMLNVPACISQNFAAVSPCERVQDLYLFYQLEAQYEALRRWSQGTNQQALNCALVRAFPVRVPPPGRQQEIIDSISAVDAMVAEADRRLTASKELLRRMIDCELEWSPNAVQ